MLALLLQVTTGIALSGIALYLIGPIYLIVGGLVAISLFAILVGQGWFYEDPTHLGVNRRDDFEGHDLSLFALEFFYRLMLAVLIGAFWPSLPIMLWRGGVRDGVKRRGQSIER